MNLSQLYYFRKLAELQHYTHAAKELYITQPTLSNSIASLEKELGIPLFERDGRNVKLTRYGREFFDYTTEALNMLDKGVAIAHEHAGSPSGSISIGSVYTIQADYLPALVTEFRKQYGQNAHLNVYQGLTTSLIEDLENDRYEIAFAAYVPNKRNLTYIPVLAHHFACIMHKDNPLARKDVISLKDMREAGPIFTYPPSVPIGAEVESVLTHHHISATHPIYNDEITLASMVESEPEATGISLNSLGLAPFKDLVARPLVEFEYTVHRIYLVYKTNAFKTRAVENFIDLVKKFEWSDEQCWHLTLSGDSPVAHTPNQSLRLKKGVQNDAEE